MLGQDRPAVSLEAAIVARRYYIDDKQKNEIADELGISRFKVARLLDEAKASGIVRISVDMPADIDLPLGEELSRAFGIQRAIVVRAIEAAPDATGALIGDAAAQYLAGIVGADDVLGISWGSSLTAFVDAVTTLAPAEVVQMVGGVRAAQMDVSGVELVRRLTRKTGGRAFPLHAPLLVRTATMAEELRADPSLADATGRFSRLSIALVGIGSWNPPKSSLHGEFTDAERADLESRGAAADVCTIVFDADGSELHSPALERAVGISAAELRGVPEVVAVAGGDEKVAAIRAALRSGVVRTLVTDSRTAEALLPR
ncbi:transcriptional regulator [Herbiconiux sp. CPCC 203407]|uniref:Transcriptional regulator n=1 Tax=Herbiconiux oxytropis TaxID=2970915 RepID=A0AA41XF33_9MICO|nr:sugar-binding domain-containing protein [Herbiconiux oxytropis]MCS5720618.1 transcriptional regulator [Herbiconiux oxytropis]MCS5725055.1 transcriptional regulator [Herbiconiux oxytropis]